MKSLIRNSRVMLAIALMTTLWTACEEEPPPIVDDYMEIVSSAVSGTDMTVKLFALEELFVGYNFLQVEVLDADNKQLTNIELTLKPMMDMTTMQHTAPTEAPDVANPENGRIPAAIVFIMPSGMMNSWTLEVQVKNKDSGQEGTVTLPIEVVAPAASRMKTFEAANDSAMLFVSVVQPLAPGIGINEFRITIHERATMMSFPPVSDYSIVMEPDMPSMGHGSPNNVNPVHVDNGHYVGQVNFTMSGLWRIHLDIKKEETMVKEDLTFDIEF